ncbi:hypothetical protein Lser_V15G25608 [Lactuca serriola]
MAYTYITTNFFRLHSNSQNGFYCPCHSPSPCNSHFLQQTPSNRSKSPLATSPSTYAIKWLPRCPIISSNALNAIANVASLNSISVIASTNSIASITSSQSVAAIDSFNSIATIVSTNSISAIASSKSIATIAATNSMSAISASNSISSIASTPSSYSLISQRHITPTTSHYNFHSSGRGNYQSLKLAANTYHHLLH